jgi:homoserine kinase type II
VGLIDWGSVVDGPLLYDVASAVMYVGGPAYAALLLQAYAAAGGPATADLHQIDLMLRMRWVVQADCFAGRLASGDLTGLDEAADNQRGYDRARRALLVELA